MTMPGIFLKRGSLKEVLYNLTLRYRNIKHKGIFIGKGSILKAKEIKIGYGTRINGSIICKGTGSLEIGKFCAIGDGVRIITSNHSLDFVSIQLALQKRIVGKVFIMDKIGVKIGHDVWIGDGAIILPGVKIGNGSVIGAGAVVTKDVESYTIVGGVPATVRGRRFSQKVSEAVERLRWWDMTLSQLKEIDFLFDKPLRLMSDEEAIYWIEKAIKEITNGK